MKKLIAESYTNKGTGTANFITITGAHHYFGSNVFRVGSYVKLVKEAENHFDKDAVRVEVPILGKIGYVANTMATKFSGTHSASIISKRIGDESTAKIRLIADDGIIAEIVSEDAVTAPDAHASRRKSARPESLLKRRSVSA